MVKTSDGLNPAYVRISNKTEDLKNQEAAIQKYAQKNYKEQVKFFKDIITGSKKAYERNGFNQLHAYLAQEEPERLYVYEISRLGRDMVETLLLVRDIEKVYKVKVVTVSKKEQFLNEFNPEMRNLILGVFSWVAEWERSNLIERTRNALEAKKEELEKNGYFISKKGKKVTRLGRPEREIDWNKVREYRSKGLSWMGISKLMDFNYIWLLKKKNDLEGEEAIQ